MCYAPYAFRQVVFYLMLPNTNHPPTLTPQAAKIPLVTPSIGLNFISPEAFEFGTPARIAITMPKITIYEHSQFLQREYKVWATSKGPHIGKEIVPLQAQMVPNHSLDIGALLTNLRHEQASLPGRKPVHNCSSP